MLLALGVSAPGRAQELPSEPIVIGGGRITLGGDAAATYGCGLSGDAGSPACGEDTGFFNYTDYEHSTLRLLRLDLTASVRANGHLSVLGELRSENGGAPRPYALYLRVRPWQRRSLDVQIGLVPPTFGAFARRTYASDNILVGYPLAYQYLTSLRPDAVAANADELLRMRGRGWLSSFSLGNVAPDRGLPIATAFRWDTGVQVHASNAVVDATAAVTTGSLGNPLVGDDNAGKQIAGRLSLHPVAGLIVGVSGARGPFLARNPLRDVASASRNRAYAQTALGADVEYSRDYYLVRVETIVSHWTLPVAGAPAIHLPLGAVSTSVEGRYKIRPRLYAAARVDHLGFSTITGTNRTDTWEAPVSRIEVGGGYLVQRNLQVKLSLQHNARDGGRVHHLNMVAGQVVFWF
jgi:hypothetical protein